MRMIGRVLSTLLTRSSYLEANNALFETLSLGPFPDECSSSTPPTYNTSTAEFVPIISSFIHSPSSIAFVRSLRGEEAQGLIEIINQVRIVQSEHTVTPLNVWELNIGHRPLRCLNWTKSSGNNACTYCTRCAKTAKHCRPRIPCSKDLCVPVPFAVTVDLQTSAQETTWGAALPSNTSGSGQRTCPTRFSRYSNPHPPCIAPWFTSKTAVLSGDHSLEASFPSQRLAVIGGFILHGPLLVSHDFRLDAKWGRDGIYQVQPRRESFGAGEPTRCFPDPVLSVP